MLQTVLEFKSRCDRIQEFFSREAMAFQLDARHRKPDELVLFPTAPQIHANYSELAVLYADDQARG